MKDSCFILGNGPSLAYVPNSILDKLPTFGSNRIFLKYIPNYYVCINPTEANKYPDEIEKLKCPKFVTDSVSIKDAIPLHSTSTIDFSIQPLECVNEGWTVTYVAMQLAYWLGYKTVYLLGVDHKYDYSGSPNEKITWTGLDTNHFSTDYVQPGDSWNCPDLKKSEKYYQIAKWIFESDGRRIINLTKRSALNVFPRGRVEDIE